MCSLSDDSLDGRQALVSADIPQTVQGVIQARVSALPARMASLLRTAAVIGIEFSKALLDHVFEGERNDSAFDALISSDLIYCGTDAGIYRFKHGLTREVVYESVLMSERRRIHAAVASAIEQGVHANPSTHTSEALAYHYRGSGDFERAAHHATLAGDRAMLASALDRARYHYLAALNALERLPMTLENKRRWLSISAKWALPFVFSPARDQLLILHTATAYATELSDYAAKAACGHWLGWAHYTLGDYTLSIEHYQNALDLAQQQGDRRLVAQLFSVLGQSQAASGSYVTAIGNLEHGLALKKNHALNQAGRVAGFRRAMRTRSVARRCCMPIAVSSSSRNESSRPRSALSLATITPSKARCSVCAAWLCYGAGAFNRHSKLRFAIARSRNASTALLVLR